MQSLHVEIYKSLSDGRIQHSSGNKKAEEDAARDAEEKVQEIKKAGGKAGDKLIEDLLKAVTEIELEVPDRIVGPKDS